MKYNKGFAPLILVAIIVGALVIGGGVYYLGKSKGEDKKVGENLNVENQVTDNSENTKNNVVSDCTNKAVPSIKVLSPNGGEIYKAGDKVTVKWESCNFSPSISAGGLDIVIFISNLSGSGLPNWMIGEATKNDGQELITLPTTLPDGSPLSYGNNFKISIGKNDPSAQSEGIGDSSDNLFTILANSGESSITKNDVTFQPAYLKAVYTKNSKNYIDVDYIQMFATIEEQKKAAVEDGECKDIITCDVYNNGYKRNTNPLIRTFEVSSSALINVYGIVGNVLFNNANGNNQTTSFDKFLSTISSSKIKDDYVKIDVKDGKVVKIVEPYQE